LTLLGLGADGHTASLLPGEPVLEERKQWAAAVSHERPEIRITMTYPVIESSVAFLVMGREKAAMLRTIRVAHPIFVADAGGVHRLDSARAHRGGPPILVIMGVSGVGKSTIADELAVRLGWAFEDGDALHPEVNIAKMHAGIPLTDADRQPWLERVAAWIGAQRTKKQPGIIVCSALKRSYRHIIVGDRPEVRLVYLRGGRDLIAAHLARRNHHFMPASLMQSQIDTLEEPDSDEDPLTVDVGPPAGQIAQEIIRLLAASVKIDESATPA
jgi:carbohydrate kinase (thermoresistant glucokinase family)